MVMKEQISSLMDDEFAPEAAEHLFKALSNDAELRKSWSVYHLIGDSLRGNSAFSPDFEARLLARLEAEPTVLAPHRVHKRKPSLVLPAAASMAAIIFVGWVAMQQMDAPTTAIPPTPSIAETDIALESIHSYLLAHQELSPVSVHAPRFMRPVAFAGNGN